MGEIEVRKWNQQRARARASEQKRMEEMAKEREIVVDASHRISNHLFIATEIDGSDGTIL